MDFCTNCVNEYAWRPSDNPFPRECKECEVIDGKPSNFKPKPQTNADRIRAMSDEELAELFGSIVDNGMSCSLICGNLDNCKRNNSIERICKNHYLEWLKQPAE